MNYSTLIIDGYNAVVGPTNNLPLDDIQAHPEEYPQAWEVYNAQ